MRLAVLRVAFCSILLAGAAPPAWAAAPPSVREDFDLTALVRSLVAAVVDISILKQRAPATGKVPEGGMMMTGPVREFGSGFIIDPAGYIVTNRHVIAQAYKVTVTFSDGTAYPAKVLATNETPDLALLKIDTPGKLPTVRFGDSDAVKVGETVVAIGNPLGLASSVTVGIVSALNRDVGESMFDDFIQTDAAINHGNSGGPLFNLRGEVIGVNWALISPNSTSGSIGLGLAIPANATAWVVDQMRRYGRVKPGWIGVQVQPVTQEIADAAGRSTRDGGMVAALVPGSEAASLLHEGDIILDFNGQHADDTRELSRAIAYSTPGTVAQAKVWRDGALLTIGMKVADWPPGPTHPAGEWVMPSRGRRVSEPPLGLVLSAVTDELRQRARLADGQAGVAVVGVAANSPGADAGFATGDVITRVQDHPVAAPDDLKQAIAAAMGAGRRSVLALVHNQNGVRWVAVPTDAH